MSNIPYTDANREKLAEAVVENMDIKDMIQALYEQELECYEQCEDTFQELWYNYYGDESEGETYSEQMQNSLEPIDGDKHE
jgi:hypothetical protein